MSKTIDHEKISLNKLGAAELLPFLGSAFKLHPAAFFGALAQAVMSAAQNFIPLLLGMLITAVLANNIVLAIVSTALIAIFFIAPHILNAVSVNALIGLTERLGGHYDREIIEIFAKFPTIEPLQDESIKSRVREFTEQSGVLGDCFGALISMFSILIQPIVLIITAVVIDPILIFVVLAAMPIMLMARYVPVWRERAESESAQPAAVLDAYAQIFSQIEPAIEMRLSGVRRAHFQRVVNAAKAWRQPFLSGNLAAISFEMVAGIVFWLISAVFVGILLNTGHLDTAGMAALLAFLYCVIDGFREVPYTWRMATDMLRSLGRFRWLRLYAQQLADAEPKAALETSAGAQICLKNVTYSYPDTNKYAVCDINLTIPQGASIALVGENGSGKTTLARLICGLLRPSSGEILVGDTAFSKVSAQSWQRHFSVVQQDYCKYDATVHTNIGLPHFREQQNEYLQQINTRLETMRDDEKCAVNIGEVQRVRAAAMAADAQNVAHNLPNGFDEVVGVQPESRNLSGGQWQKLATARGLYPEKPAALVLDEPTAALDAFAEQRLYDQLVLAKQQVKLANGGLLLITHRLSTVRAADLIVVLAKGKIVESGTFEQLIAADGIFAQIYEIQAKGYQAAD